MRTLFVAVVGFLLTGAFLMLASFFVQSALARGGGVSAWSAGRRRQKRNTVVLWGLILLALAYAGLFRYLHTLTGVTMLDGSIGLALGLYICAHPAANAVDMLFFERDALDQMPAWAVVRWLALNLLVLLAGWMVVFLALRRLV